MKRSTKTLKIPQATLPVSRARSKLARLLRQLDGGPRVFFITRKGRPAGALISPKWLQALLDQASGRKRFSIFGLARAAEDWELALREIRRAMEKKTIERWDRIHRQTP